MGIKKQRNIDEKSMKSSGFDEDALMLLLKMGEVTGKLID